MKNYIDNESMPKMRAAAQDGAVALNMAAQEYAHKLQPVAEKYRETGARYVEQVVSMSTNVVVILNRISSTPKATPIREPDFEWLQALLFLVDAGQRGATIVHEFQQSVQKDYAFSRAIRKPLELLSEGAQRFLDGQALMDDWKRRIGDILAEHPPQPGSASGNGQGAPTDS